MTDTVRDTLRTQLTDALTAYDRHAWLAQELLTHATDCDCDTDELGCPCDPEEPEYGQQVCGCQDGSVGRAEAATHAQLAVAAAGIAQAMAALLANR